MQLTDGKIDLYSGNDDQIVPLLSVGGKGVISVLANVAPQYTHDICAKFFEGDVKGSCKMQLDAIPLIEKLFCEVNPIPVKKALNLMGWQAGPLRMPLTEMTEAHTAQLAKELEAFGIKTGIIKGQIIEKKGLTGVSISSFCAIQEFVKRYTRKWR